MQRRRPVDSAQLGLTRLKKDLKNLRMTEAQIRDVRTLHSDRRRIGLSHKNFAQLVHKRCWLDEIQRAYSLSKSVMEAVRQKFAATTGAPSFHDIIEKAHTAASAGEFRDGVLESLQAYVPHHITSRAGYRFHVNFGPS